VGPRLNLIPDTSTGSSELAKTFTASVLVVLCGLSLLWFSTNGGQGFTTETIRRSEILQKPQQITGFNLSTSDGKVTSLKSLLQTDQRIWVVDFVYTRCQTLCRVLGTAYQQLQADIIERGLQDKVGLLSISFDPEQDDELALKKYEKRMGINPNVWRVAAIKNPKDRQRLLDTFGIVVIPAPLGEYEHNAALHLVTSKSTLVSILGYEDLPNVIAEAIAISEQRLVAK
jgi:protein SCO1